MFTASVATLTSGLYGFAAAGIVGLSITHAFNMAAYIQWLMRESSELEMKFTCVERVDQMANVAAEPQVTNTG